MGHENTVQGSSTESSMDSLVKRLSAFPWLFQTLVYGVRNREWPSTPCCAITKKCWVTRMCSGVLSALSPPLTLCVLAAWLSSQVVAGVSSRPGGWPPDGWREQKGMTQLWKECYLDRGFLSEPDSVTLCWQREMDVQSGGWMDGWVDEGETDMGVSHWTRHNLSSCDITSTDQLIWGTHPGPPK